MLTVSGCMDSEVEPPKDLSQDLYTLSYYLSFNQSCDKKREYLEQWLEKNDSVLEKDLANFRKQCPAGSASGMQCMSHQIISSASVEVALGECLKDGDMHKVVERLNQKAGIAVGMTQPNK